MRDLAPNLLLFAALGIVVLIYLRWRKMNVGTATAASVPPAPAGAPLGAGAVPLGQFAVDPSRQWLLLQPGE